MRVLLVDDHRLFLDGLQRLLEAYGVEVAGVATDGLEAVTQARALKPDVTLMDIHMPEMDGYEAIRQIRKFNTGVIIISQTAYALEGDREKSMEAGCTDYISKPIRKKDLIALIQKHFNLMEKE